MNGKQTKKMRKYARQTFERNNAAYRRQMSGFLWQDFFIVVSRLCLKSRIRLALMIVFRKRIGK